MSLRLICPQLYEEEATCILFLSSLCFSIRWQKWQIERQDPATWWGFIDLLVLFTKHGASYKEFISELNMTDSTAMWQGFDSKLRMTHVSKCGEREQRYGWEESESGTPDPLFGSRVWYAVDGTLLGHMTLATLATVGRTTSWHTALDEMSLLAFAVGHSLQWLIMRVRVGYGMRCTAVSTRHLDALRHIMLQHALFSARYLSGLHYHTPCQGRWCYSASGRRTRSFQNGIWHTWPHFTDPN